MRTSSWRWLREATVFFSADNVLGNHFLSGYLRDLSDWLGWDPSLKVLHPLRSTMSGNGALKKDLSRLFLRDKICLIYIVDLFLGKWFNILVFAGDAEIAPKVSRRDSISTWVETDGQPKVRRTVVTRRLVSLAVRFIVTYLKLSTVGVEVGS